MHYVRLLKHPRISRSRGRPQLDLLFTIQTDLGDETYPCEFQIAVLLHAQSDVVGTRCLFTKVLTWKATDRHVCLSEPIERWRPSSAEQVFVELTPGCPTDVSFLDDNYTVKRGQTSIALPLVLGIRTLPFGVSETSFTKQVVRPIPCFSVNSFAIAEDLGESIARHVWDAGAAAAALVALTGRPEASRLGPLSELFNDFRRQAENGQRIKVLELGAGVGLFGSAIAASIRNADVVLTDLEEARELIEANIHNIERHSNKSTMRFRPLDWTERLPHEIQQLKLDLIVASDCTYNPDYSPALVKTIHELEMLSPGVRVIVASKERHASEQVFLEAMREARFIIAHHQTILSPLDDTIESLDEAEHIDIIIFERV